MAENKKSVLLYCDIITTVEELTDDEAGRLFKHYLRYINDLNPVAPDKLTQIVFEPIKQNLKRDLKKWEGSKETKSDAGALGNLKRWNNDLYLKVISNEMDIKEAVEIAKGRYAIKKSQTVANVAVTVTDTVTVTEREINFTPGFEGLEKCTEVALKDDRYLRENKTNMRELQIFNKFLSKQEKKKKTLLDYKQHFSNWKSAGKLAKFIEENSKELFIAPQVGTGGLAVMKALQNRRNESA